jgi:hypothetical protein
MLGSAWPLMTEASFQLRSTQLVVTCSQRSAHPRLYVSICARSAELHFGRCRAHHGDCANIEFVSAEGSGWIRHTVHALTRLGRMQVGGITVREMSVISSRNAVHRAHPAMKMRSCIDIFGATRCPISLCRR